MKTKRIISLILASLMLFGALASCSEKPVEAGGSADTTAAAEETTSPYLDKLGAYNFDGESFTVYCRSDTEYEIKLDESTGDTVEDEIYKRNLELGERFNVSIETYAADGLWPDRDAFMRTLTDSISAGEGAFDLVVGYEAYMSGVNLVKYLSDFNSLPAIDLDAEYYYQDIISETAVNGKNYYLSGDMTITVWKYLYVYFFNKQLAEDYHLPDLYQLVRDGKWTIDKLIELSADIYSDINGDSKRDSGDLYGLATDYGNVADAYYSAFEIPITTVDADGTRVINSDLTKFDGVVQKLASYWNDTNGVYTFTMTSTMTSNPLTDMFVDNRALFYPDMLDNAVSFRGLEADFGIIPYPKWDETQESYRTQSWNGYNVMLIPKDMKNPEKTGVMVEAMNAASLKTVLPAYYDTALKLKFTRDDESGEMLDLIRGGISYQFGYFYMVSLYNGCDSYRIRDILKSKKPNTASTFKSSEKKLTSNLNSILSAFDTSDTAEG